MELAKAQVSAASSVPPPSNFGLNIIQNDLWCMSGFRSAPDVMASGERVCQRALRCVIQSRVADLRWRPERPKLTSRLGSGPGTIPLAEIISAIPQFMAIAATGDLPIDLDEVPLAEVESAWQRSSGGRRTVLRP